ncbi:MAG TPA: hypothetical protein VIF37_06615 [Methylobacter sp.]
MDKKREVMRILEQRMDEDESFAVELGNAVESGTWEIVASLIAKVAGFVIDNTSEVLDWLKEIPDRNGSYN